MAITTSTSAGGLGGPGGPLIPKFYADFMRDRLWSSLYFRQLGTEVTVPRGYETVKIPRWKSPYFIRSSYPNPSATTYATVTTVHESASITTGLISAESISGDVSIFVGAIAYTEKSVLVSHASLTDGATENLVKDLVWKLDTHTRTQISSVGSSNETGSTNANGHVTSTDYIDGASVAKIGPLMDSYNVPRWEDETFVCVVHPLAMYDLMTDTAATGFLDVAKYTDPGPIYRGEVGRLYGIRFVQTNNLPIVAIAVPPMASCRRPPPPASPAATPTSSRRTPSTSSPRRAVASA